MNSSFDAMRDSAPLVSVVTPTKNRSGLLEATLRSVRGQTYPNVEHIVVDGGSNDDTMEMLRRYEHTYELRWLSEPDGGMYEAVNKGLDMAKGDILAYLNSDDLYFPWTVEVVVEGFRRHREADFVFGDALNIDNTSGRHHVVFQPPFDVDFIRRAGFLAQPTVFWRRRVHEAERGFDSSLHYVADCDFWMRTGDRYRFVKLNEFVAIERDHRSTLRESHREDLDAELRAVRSRYVRLRGLRHAVAVRRHVIRSMLWHRMYWMAFAVQNLLPEALRHGSWSRLVQSRQTRPRVFLVPLLLVQRHGRQFSMRLVEPSRHWLDPQ